MLLVGRAGQRQHAHLHCGKPEHQLRQARLQFGSHGRTSGSRRYPGWPWSNENPDGMDPVHGKSSRTSGPSPGRA